MNNYQKRLEDIKHNIELTRCDKLKLIAKLNGVNITYEEAAKNLKYKVYEYNLRMEE